MYTNPQAVAAALDKVTPFHVGDQKPHGSELSLLPADCWQHHRFSRADVPAGDDVWYCTMGAVSRTSDGGDSIRDGRAVSRTDWSGNRQVYFLWSDLVAAGLTLDDVAPYKSTGFVFSPLTLP